MAVKSKKKFDRVIGIDLGNGLVKIRSITKKGEEYNETFPSAFAYSKAVGEVVNDNSLDVETFTINDMQYVWGNEVTKISDIKSTYGHESRYRTEAFKIMAKIVMAHVVRDLQIESTEKILVVTGVPSAETGTVCEEDIAQAFYGDNKGIHEVGVEDEEYIFKVAHVEVMPQALSTVLGRYLDEDGTVENAEYEESKVAVIDIGGGTTDLDIVHMLRRQKGFHSVPKGFRDIYDGIRSEIRKRYPNHTVTDYDLLDILDEVSNQEKKSKSTRTKLKYEYKPSKLKDPVDFTKALDDGVKELVVDTQQAIMSKWKDQTDLDEILLVGGSAELFKEHIDEIVEGITIPVNNGNSNVEGYYRFGVYFTEND